MDAVNIAPELGIAETRAFLRLLTMLDLPRVRDGFLELAYGCGAWRKWLAPRSSADDLQRCVLAGHYVYASPAFKELKAQVRHACRVRGLALDAYLRGSVETVMERYMHNAGMMRGREAVGARR